MRLQDAINEAIHQARRSNMNQKHGCVIFDTEKPNPVSKAHNVLLKSGTGPHKNSIHAEVRAISKLHENIDPQECIMVVVRVSPGNNIAYSKPCDDCQNVIERSGITTVYYSTNYTDVDETV